MHFRNRLLEQVGIDLPIIQAPMAGASGTAMAIAVSEAGGLGSLPCAMLDADGVRSAIGVIQHQTSRPLNVNFFVHQPPAVDPAREAAWRTRLAPYYEEFGLDQAAIAPSPVRAPFDETTCAIVEELKPAVVSFHFGLPKEELMARVRNAGCLVFSSATTVGEAVWLEEGDATRSSLRDTRPAVTAACSWTMILQARSGPWLWYRRSSMP